MFVLGSHLSTLPIKVLWPAIGHPGRMKAISRHAIGPATKVFAADTMSNEINLRRTHEGALYAINGTQSASLGVSIGSRGFVVVCVIITC